MPEQVTLTDEEDHRVVGEREVLERVFVGRAEY
jgi:hypothetical protein